MIKDICIKNFRGIQEANIRNSKRINVVVGPNGTGKTALLEGIFLSLGSSPEAAFRLRGWRGREGQFSGPADQAMSALLLDTFRDPNAGHASINISFDDSTFRKLEISKNSRRLSVQSIDKELVVDNLISFAWSGTDKEEVVITPRVIVDSVRGNRFEFGAIDWSIDCNFFAARVNANEEETARSYSKLYIEGNSAKFDKIMKDEYPIIRDIKILSPFGPATLFATLTNNRTHPLTMISGGVNHLASILTRLASSRNSVSLIDEIENGFYYDRYQSIWRILYDMCVEMDSQIFVTTHSRECLIALSEALQDEAEDIHFIRTRIDENSEIRYREISGPSFFKGLQLGEMR